MEMRGRVGIEMQGVGECVYVYMGVESWSGECLSVRSSSAGTGIGLGGCLYPRLEARSIASLLLFSRGRGRPRCLFFPMPNTIILLRHHLSVHLLPTRLSHAPPSTPSRPLPWLPLTPTVK